MSASPLYTNLLQGLQEHGRNRPLAAGIARSGIILSVMEIDQGPFNFIIPVFKTIVNPDF